MAVLAVSAAAATVASAIIVNLAAGVLWPRIGIPWTVTGVLATAAMAILAAAWPIRQYVKGKRRTVDPLRAATILALAKACALGGAALAGVYLAIALVTAGELHSPLAWSRLWQALAAGLAGAGLAAAGRLAEWFCQLPPEDSAPKNPAAGRPDTSPA
jgi:hypothetical protein